MLGCCSERHLALAHTLSTDILLSAGNFAAPMLPRSRTDGKLWHLQRHYFQEAAERGAGSDWTDQTPADVETW